MIERSFLSLFLFICVKTTSSFNVDESGESYKLVRPYSVPANQNISNPIFFGYDINVRKSSDTTSR